MKVKGRSIIPVKYEHFDLERKFDKLKKDIAIQAAEFCYLARKIQDKRNSSSICILLTLHRSKSMRRAHILGKTIYNFNM